MGGGGVADSSMFTPPLREIKATDLSVFELFGEKNVPGSAESELPKLFTIIKFRLL